jgi:predicted DNA-binding protein YlxM (UPF0122 family)
MPGINFRHQQLHGLDTAQQAWRLYVQHGLTHAQIATELSVTRSAVTKAIKRAEQLGLETLKASVSAHKAIQLARLERIYCLALEGYERSIGERLKKASKSKTAKGGDERWAEVRSEDRHGDPRWLHTALSALSDMRKLLGLDSPLKVQPVEPDRPYVGLTDQEVRTQLNAMLLTAGIGVGLLPAVPAGPKATP